MIFFARMTDAYDFSFAFGMSAYQGDAIFYPIARYSNGKIILTNETVKADTIYHYNRVVRDGFDAGSAGMINTPSFKDFSLDKWRQYQYLRKFFPPTSQLNSLPEINNYLDSFSAEDMVVLKPVTGSSGAGVVVCKKKDVNLANIAAERLAKNGYLGQEFIDTSAGVPSIATGIHDIRIMTMIDDIVLCHVRTPQAGEFVANTHKGALMQEVKFDRLPASVKDFYFEVHAKLKEKHPSMLYSMDIGLVESRHPLLIEINAHTAFPRKDFIVFRDFIDTLVRVLGNV